MKKAPKRTYNKQEYHRQTAIDYVDEGFNMTAALRKRHKDITEKGLRVKGSRLLTNDNFKKELQDYLNGLQPEIKGKLKDLLDAKRITEYKGNAKMTNLPNYSEQRKTLDIVLKLLDAYPHAKTESKNTNIEFKLRIKELNLSQLNELLSKTSQNE